MCGGLRGLRGVQGCMLCSYVEDNHLVVLVYFSDCQVV